MCGLARVDGGDRGVAMLGRWGLRGLITRVVSSVRVRRSRLRNAGVLVLVAGGLLMLTGCVADPPPLIGLAVAGNGQATVSWQAPLAAPSPITGYVVTPVIGSASQTPVVFNSTATTEVVTGLVNGTTYVFQVAAINTRGDESAWSDPSNPVTPSFFAPGDLVVVRVGDGAAALSSAATAVFLDEYTPSGALVKSIPMPTAASGGNAQLTNSGTATSEGALALSPNGHYLALAGYAANVGTTNIAGTTSSAVNRVVAVVDANGNVDTSTLLVAYSASNIRGAVTTDGTALWTGGNGTVSDGGVRYTTKGATGAGTGVATAGSANVRFPEIFNGQLYVSSGSGAFFGVNTVGTGTPTTAGNTLTNIASVAAGGYGYVFLDRDPNIPGLDTLYVATLSAAPGQGIVKFGFNGVSWIAEGGITGSFSEIAGTVSGSTAVLYATSGSTAGNTLVTLTDTAPSASTMSAGAPVTLASAAANTVLRGVAFAPVP